MMEELDDLAEKIIAQGTSTFKDDESWIDELLELLLNTREQGQMMEQLIKNQIEVKDDMLDKLHKELEYYKQDAADRFVEQLMKSVIKVRKDMNRLILSEKWNEMSADDLKREYQYCMEDITDLLEQQNIDSYSSEPGEAFDASIHLAKIEVTDDLSLDRKIKESISEGYKKGNKILLPERVTVYQYK